MERRKLYSLIIVLMISFFSFGQTDKSELVTFKNESFIEAIQKIVKPENNCVADSNTHDWYIESKEDGSFIVSINRIGNLLQSLDNKCIYTTVINSQVIFYVTNNENDDILKTGYFVNLSKYVDYEYVLFEDFSSWLIKKNEKDTFVIKDRNIFKCND